MRHQPGSEMVADVGTKPLSAVKLKEHKQPLGMSIKEYEAKPKQNHKEKSEVKKIQHEGRLKLALMMALIARGKAQSAEEDEDEGQNAFECMMIIYTVLVVTITILVQAVWKWIHQGVPGKTWGADSPHRQMKFPVMPAGRRVEVRPRKGLGCGLPSRLERPVKETGCGPASPLGENHEGLPNDAQLSCQLEGGLRCVPWRRRGADSREGETYPRAMPSCQLADSPHRSREGVTYPRAMPSCQLKEA